MTPVIYISKMTLFDYSEKQMKKYWTIKDRRDNKTMERETWNFTSYVDAELHGFDTPGEAFECLRRHHDPEYKEVPKRVRWYKYRVNTLNGEYKEVWRYCHTLDEAERLMKMGRRFGLSSVIHSRKGREWQVMLM